MLIGIVINNKSNKTINVLVEKINKHNKYKKIIFYSKHIMAHDENNIANIGNIVLIKETIPISKKKSWSLFKILKN